MGTLADTKGFKKPVFTISMETAMTVTFAVTAVWWIAMTILLLKTYRQKYYAEKKEKREELIKSKLAVTEEY